MCGSGIGVSTRGIGLWPGAPPGRSLAAQLRQSSIERFGSFSTSACPAPSAERGQCPRSAYLTVQTITPFLSLTVIRPSPFLSLPRQGPNIRTESGISYAFRTVEAGASERTMRSNGRRNVNPGSFVENAGNSYSTACVTFQFAISNGVAVLL